MRETSFLNERYAVSRRTKRHFSLPDMAFLLGLPVIFLRPTRNSARPNRIFFRLCRKMVETQPDIGESLCTKGIENGGLVGCFHVHTQWSGDLVINQWRLIPPSKRKYTSISSWTAGGDIVRKGNAGDNCYFVFTKRLVSTISPSTNIVHRKIPLSNTSLSIVTLVSVGESGTLVITRPPILVIRI